MSALIIAVLSVVAVGIVLAVVISAPVFVVLAFAAMGCRR